VCGEAVVVLVDRNVDMSVMFHHTWTYQALVHDLLDMKLNTIRLEQEVEADAASGKSGGVETKIYDLDPASDGFWIANAGNPWTKVVGTRDLNHSRVRWRVRRVRRECIGEEEVCDVCACVCALRVMRLVHYS
jgi:hypothetical protein